MLVYTVLSRNFIKLNGNYPNEQHEQRVKTKVLDKVSSAQLTQNKTDNLL